MGVGEGERGGGKLMTIQIATLPTPINTGGGGGRDAKIKARAYMFSPIKRMEKSEVFLYFSVPKEEVLG